jgi:hypothetical protein
MEPTDPRLGPVDCRPSYTGAQRCQEVQEIVRAFCGYGQDVCVTPKPLAHQSLSIRAARRSP